MRSNNSYADTSEAWASDFEVVPRMAFSMVRHRERSFRLRSLASALVLTLLMQDLCWGI